MTSRDQRRAVAGRDAALRRLRRVKGMLATASVLLTGGLATAAAATFPGHAHSGVSQSVAPRRAAPTDPAVTGVGATRRDETGAATAPDGRRAQPITPSAGTGASNHRTHSSITPPAAPPTPAAPASATVTSGGS